MRPRREIWMLTVAWAGLAAALALAASCAEEVKGHDPLTDGFHYPLALAVDQEHGLLFVVNSNFDLRYRLSSMVTVDVETLKFAQPYLAMGSFAGELALTAWADDGRFGYLAVRGDNSLTWFAERKSGKSVSLVCNDDNDAGDPECSGGHVVTDGTLLVPDEEGDSLEEDVELGSDPYALALLPSPDAKIRHRVLVGSMRAGRLTLLEVRADNPVPVVVGQYQALSGLHSAVADPSSGLIYVTNKFYAVVYKLRVNEGADGPELELLDALSLPAPYNSGDFGRGIALAQGGRMLLVAYRTPAGLVAIPASDENETFAQGPLTFVPLGARPGQVRVFPSGQDGREVAYVVCFGDDTVWMVDPATLLPLGRFSVGAGPYDMAAVLKKDVQRGFVSNFLDDTVSVVDLDPTHDKTYHRQTGVIQ